MTSKKVVIKRIPEIPSVPIAPLLAGLFKKLEAEGVAYAVIRNYEGLPERIGHDVDLLVDNLPLFEKAALEVAANAQWKIARRLRRHSTLSLFFWSPPNNVKIIVKIDAIAPFTWKGIELISQEVLKKKHRHEKGFFILPPGAEAAMSVIKGAVYHGKVDEKYKPLIPPMVRTDPESFHLALDRCFGHGLTEKLVELACREDWRNIEKLTSKLRRKAILRAFGRQPKVQLYHCFNFFWRHLRKFFHPTGGFIVLIGPDGSGKSTVANGLKQQLWPLFDDYRYFHGHFEILPRLRDLAQLVGLKETPENFPEKPALAGSNEKTREFGRLRSIVYLIYYTFDYLLGYPVIFRARGRGHLVIFDRYYYDYLIQPGMSIPAGLLWILMRLVPQPDVVIYLKNNSDTIFARKSELRTDELSRQGEICSQIINRLPQGYELETTGTPTETTLEVARVLVEKMSQEISSRYGR
jgi:thymidylate kinase